MWPCTPLTTRRPDSVPRRPFLTMSPTRFTEVGSPTMQASKGTPRCASTRTTCCVPCSDGPSSSLVSSKATVPGWPGWAATNSSAATVMQATAVFMSAAPRPKSRPSRCVGTKGSLCQCSSGPVGTTSVWPASTRVGPGTAPTCTAQRLATRASSGPASRVSQTKPAACSRAASSAWLPPSAGVTERQAIRASVRRSAAWGSRGRSGWVTSAAPRARARRGGPLRGARPWSFR